MPLTHLMSYETWKSSTGVTGMPRSKELRAIDTAFEKYEAEKTEKRLAKLRVAWEVWRALHPDIQHHLRNRQNVLVIFNEQLYSSNDLVSNFRNLADLAELPFCGLEAVAAKSSVEALRLMRAARQESLNTLLAGKKIVFKPTGLDKIRNGVKSAVSAVRGSKKANTVNPPKNTEFKFEGIDMVGTIGGALQEFSSVGDLSGSRVKDFLEHCVNEILADLLNEFINEVVGEVSDRYPDRDSSQFHW